LREEYAQLNAAANRAANAQAAAALNVKRAYLNLAPVLGAAKQQLGALARQNRGLSARIAVKFDAPKDVGRVAANASRALRAGAPARIVTKIIADSKSAEQAIARINRVVFALKRVPIVQQGGDRAIAILERLKGTKLTKKEQQIAERGGPKVLQLLQKLLGFRIPDKAFTVKANDQASRVLGSVIGQLNSIDGRVANSYVRTHYSSTRSGPTPFAGQKGAAGGVFAAGGSTGSTPDQNRIERAANEAALRQTRDIRGGGVVNRPTYLTGEENRREIVISTNPAYRRQNLAYLRQAARSLGSDVISAASGYDSGGVGGQGYYAPNTKIGVGRPGGVGNVGNKRVRKIARNPKKRRKLYSRQDNWARYIAGLHTQQEDWEREVSIREQGVIEPESFIKEVSRTPDQTLPDGTVVPGVPTFDIDTGVISAFTGQLQLVQDAYNKLIQITAELVRSLPRAINAADTEWRVRDVRADKFKDARDRHRRIARATKDEGVKKHHNKKADDADKALQAERDEQRTLRENIGAYHADRKEAGFDEREFRLSSEDYGRQIDAVGGRAQEEKTRENEQGAGGSGGGGGATTTPVGVQMGLLDAAKMDVLKEFAGNFGAVGATPGGLGGAGVGNLANLGRNPVVAGAAIGGAIGAGLGGAGVSSIMGAGTAAGMAVAQPTVAGGFTAAGAAPATGGDKNVVVNNYYQEQPADPHTWSSNTAFELGALID
jgi:hypothetical protein